MNNLWNLSPEEINALGDFSALAQSIYNMYEEEKASRIVGSIIQKIAKGGSYHDIYEYCRTLNLGKIFKKAIDVHYYAANIHDYVELSKSFMITINQYAKDIQDMTELVQKSLNDSMHIGIKPKQAPLDKETLQKTLDKLIEGITNEDENAFGIFDSELMKWAIDFVDGAIKSNAELQSKSGFNIVIIRRYDDVGIHNYANYSDKRKAVHAAEVCKFCKDREGVYEYENTKKNNFVYQRHPGCTCSIDYVNKGMSKTVWNYSGYINGI